MDTPDTTREVVDIDPAALSKLNEDHLKLVAADAQKLLSTDAGTAVACLVMKTARQLFVLAAQSLERRLTELRANDPAVIKFLHDSMLFWAKREFTREEVAQAISKQVVPFMANELACEGQRQQDTVAETEKAADSERRQLIVPTGLRPELLTGLTRGTCNVVVGPAAVLSHVVSAVNAYNAPTGEFNPVVVTLSNRMQLVANVSAGKDKRRLAIPANRWIKQGRSVKTLTDCINPWLKQTHQNRVDLLVIEDMVALADGMEILGPVRLVSALTRQLCKWADAAGCAVLGMLPFELSDEIYETPDAEWTELLAHHEVWFLKTTEDRPCWSASARRMKDGSVHELLTDIVTPI